MHRLSKAVLLAGAVLGLAGGAIGRGTGAPQQAAAPAPAGRVPAFDCLNEMQQRVAVRQTAHFAVAHAAGDTAAADLGVTLEAVFARYQHLCRAAGLIAREPARPLPWLCFDRPTAFQTYVSREESVLPIDERTFYSSRSDCVVLLQPPAAASPAPKLVAEPQDLRRITHEAAHQLAFDTGLQARGVLYPFWVS